MKKWFCISMSLLIVLLSLQQSIIILHFKLNQNYIEQNLCINKNRPELECHGKCQLEKELKNSGDDLQSIKGFSLYETIAFIPISLESWKISFSKVTTLNSQTFYFEKLSGQSWVNLWWHPPMV